MMTNETYFNLLKDLGRTVPGGIISRASSSNIGTISFIFDALKLKVSN